MMAYMTQSMMNVFVQFASSRDRWTFDSSSIKLNAFINNSFWVCWRYFKKCRPINFVHSLCKNCSRPYL